MLEFLKINTFALHFTSISLRSDKNFMMKCSKIDGYALHHASEDL